MPIDRDAAHSSAQAAVKPDRLALSIGLVSLALLAGQAHLSASLSVGERWMAVSAAGLLIGTIATYRIWQRGFPRERKRRVYALWQCSLVVSWGTFWFRGLVDTSTLTLIQLPALLVFLVALVVWLSIEAPPNRDSAKTDITQED